jgi:hypothetical protein
MYLIDVKNSSVAAACSTPRKMFIHGRLARNARIPEVATRIGRVSNIWKKKR